MTKQITTQTEISMKTIERIAAFGKFCSAMTVVTAMLGLASKIALVALGG